MKLVSRVKINKPDTVYNLHIQNDHNYIVNGAVVSNCHTLKADALKSLLTGVMSHIPIRWGLTGTIPKEEYAWQSLHCSIGPVINKLSAAELQDKGVLAQCHVNIAQLIDHAAHNDYQSELRYLLENTDRLAYIAGMIDNISKTGNTLVLVDRVNPGKMLSEMIENSVFVSGGTKSTTRQVQYSQVDSQDNTTDNKIIIATYGVASTGINIVKLHNVVLVEPGKSFVRTIQSIGRGLRKGFDKDFVNIWDITSTCRFSKRHLTKRKEFYKEAEYPFTQEKVDWMGVN